MWFWNFLRAIGRGIGTLLRVLLWEPLVEIVRGLGRGVGDLVRTVAPWAIGAMVVWGVLVYQPELFKLALAILIMVWGLKIMISGLRPARKKKKK